MENQLIFSTNKTTGISDNAATLAMEQPTDGIIGSRTFIQITIRNKAQTLILMPLHLTLPARRISPKPEFFPTDRFTIAFNWQQAIGITPQGLIRRFQRKRRGQKAVTVVTSTTFKNISTATTFKVIGTISTIKAITPRTTIETVIAFSTYQNIVTTITNETIILIISNQKISKQTSINILNLADHRT